MPRAPKLSALVLGATLLVVGCADLPTAPQPEADQVEVAPSNGLLGDLVGLVGGTVTTVTGVVEGILSPVLNRSEPLRQDEVVSQWVGPWGGVIHLERAGLTVVVPRGALGSWTRITVRAPAGDLLGYEFGPHGLEFDRPVTLVQEVTSEEAAGGLELMYFDGSLQPQVSVLEVLPTLTVGGRVVSQIEHFSGYAYRRGGYVIATN